MAGLAAAWRLTDPRPDGDEATRSPCTSGGPGSAAREPARAAEHGRIEEHGLHVWLGHYDNAFRLLRECYGELDRATTDPGCPIPDVARRVPDRPTSSASASATRPGGMAGCRVPGRRPSARRTRRRRHDDARRRWCSGSSNCSAELGASMQSRGPRRGRAEHPAPGRRPGASPPALRTDRRRASGRARRDGVRSRAARRACQFVDFLCAVVRGIFADDLFRRCSTPSTTRTSPTGSCATGRRSRRSVGPFVRGLYDLAFAYEDGDAHRPRFPAGTRPATSPPALRRLQGRAVLEDAGRHGRRGDRAALPGARASGACGSSSSTVSTTCTSIAAGDAVAAVTFGRQVDLAPGVDEYDPLVRVGDCPVFPDDRRPRPGRRRRPRCSTTTSSRTGAGGRTPDSSAGDGRDFDDARARRVRSAWSRTRAGSCSPPTPGGGRWSTTCETVATHAFQLWLDPDERALGWHGPRRRSPASAMPFDTFASMSQTCASRQWPAERLPRARPRRSAR